MNELIVAWTPNEYPTPFLNISRMSDGTVVVIVRAQDGETVAAIPIADVIWSDIVDSLYDEQLENDEVL
jgi:hypothetical protein